jgi:HD-like signal output (HDOD) protein
VLDQLEATSPDIAGVTGSRLTPEPQGDTLLIRVKLCNLPPFHPVAYQIVSLSGGRDANVARIANLVGGDPALAAEVLFLANSSLFGFPARIRSLRHAVAVLGIDRIKDLAVTVAIRVLVRGVGRLIRPCWRHSVACATIAEEIAPLFGDSADQAYTAGLLHDIGRLGFLRSYAAEASAILADEYAGVEEALAAERAALNADHGAAGSWLAQYWDLPPSFGAICEHHHDPPRDNDSELLQAIQTACRLADATGYSAVRYKSPLRYEDALASMPAKVSRRSFPREADLREQVEARLRHLDV